MALYRRKLRKSFRTLGKSLRSAARSTTPEYVHALRTRSRWLEAAIRALMLSDKRPARRLLKTMVPIRKQAGKVRDLDVFIGFVPQLTTGDKDECLVLLVEHLGAKRRKAVQKLRAMIVDRMDAAEHAWKECESLLEEQDRDTEGSSKVMAAAQEVSAELRTWPRLTRTNLHLFRLKVKELRSILELAEEGDICFLRSLGEVKDTIGVWHDWSKLEAFARDVLGEPGCGVVTRIAAKASAALRRALSVTAKMRKQYLGSDKQIVSSKQNAAKPARPVPIATAQLPDRIDSRTVSRVGAR